MNAESNPAAGGASAEPLAVLAGHLADHREAILQAWTEAVVQDEELRSSDDLSRAEFRDHIPHVLAEFERCLRAEAGTGSAPPEAYHLDNTIEHGEHRWKQGYDLREVILEWGHLHRCLLDTLETAPREMASRLNGEAFAAARRALARLIHNAIADSAEQFALLQQKEAASTREELERTVAGFIEDGERRAVLWRESAHDLRGRLSVVTSAATLLEEPDLEEAVRIESVEMLLKATAGLKDLLREALENVQTRTVREECRLGTFDAGAALGGLCAATQPLARERKLTLRSGGPESLEVEGDRGKVQRIAQNLLLNALAYTPTGGVSVSWKADDPAWWSFCVRDTGPGLPAAGGAGESGAKRPGGEGIGLSIVRRLVEVLGARLQVESAAGAGTAFTIALPRRYAAT